MKLSFTLGLAMTLSGLAFGAELRIGIIGCDTSHVTAFTELLNNPNAKGHVPGGKVVAAFKGGSPDLPKLRLSVAWSSCSHPPTTPGNSIQPQMNLVSATNAATKEDGRWSRLQVPGIIALVSSLASRRGRR